MKKVGETEIGEQKLRKLENSTANAHGAFSLGLFSTALLAYGEAPNARWAWIGIGVIGIAFLLSGGYFLFLHKWNRQKIVNLASLIVIDYVSWMLGLVALGVGLIQTRLNWAAIPGVLSIYLGYLILVIGIGKALKTLRITA